MRKPFATIKFDDTSFEVVLLHQALGALGLAVATDEVARHRAGESTRRQMRELQKQWNLQVDEATLVDGATAAALQKELETRGLTGASVAFTVMGTVFLSDGSVRRNQELLAFDLDLRGVGSYGAVKTVAELQVVGYEFVGSTVSDAQGAYSITFYDWQVQHAERLKADIVVYAVESEKEGGRILGRSRLVSSDDYESGLVRRLDVIITEDDPRTEYAIVMGEITPFLTESEVALAEIAKSSEQIAFTASELALSVDRVRAAADAAALIDKSPSHELLYGIGRQSIALDWTSLYRRHEDELRAAIAASVAQRIIRSFDEREIEAFLKLIREGAAKQVLGDEQVTAMLSNALPKESQRVSFVNAVRSFAGSDARDFWRDHLPSQPEFKADPKLVESVLQTHRLTALTGDHQPLVRELQVTRGIASPQQLVDLERKDWVEVIGKAGVPSFVEGADDAARTNRYAELMESLVNTAFPTPRITRMVDKKQLPVDSAGVSAFLKKTPAFDFATSRVHDFDRDIASPAVRSDLLKIQRVFQVSTSPETMATLLDSGLQSARSIAAIPLKSFMKTHGKALGGEREAFAIHQRASHIATRSELAAMHLYEYSNAMLPALVMSSSGRIAAQEAIKSEIVNYEGLFGAPDICECEHCRSVYSAAAYFVDLLRFLSNSDPNSAGKTPLDILQQRRPDLVHLPLSCENTNTIIPYIDLANEIMEFYVTNGSLEGFEGYDTGEATAAELRASPQNFNLEAYRTLNAAKYPFTLPYHQPLDAIRTWSDHLKVSRCEAMKAMNPAPDARVAKAIAAEGLRVSQEEYLVLTGEDFDGNVDTTSLPAYFGYATGAELDDASEVPELKHRAGIVYKDVIALVETQFINPHQGTLAFIEKVFADATIGADEIYTRLRQIAAGTLDPAADADITAALAASEISSEDFAAWAVEHIEEFREVLTLFEPESKCDLANTRMRTIRSIYENLTVSGVSLDRWSRIHRFLRLWRRLGWTIHETDLMLDALGQGDITGDTVLALASVLELATSTRLAVDQLAVLWGNIDSYGEKSLYRKLFLNKSVQQIDAAFEANTRGEYLQDGTQSLADHTPAIVAAFRIREDDLTDIFGVAEVIDGGAASPLVPEDALNLANLSAIYRHVVLAKALKLRISDFCKLIALFDASPFSDPAATLAFCELMAAVKASGFKASVLEYVLEGTLDAESSIGLDSNKVLGVARSVRAAFSTIELDHPDTPPSPLTADVLAARLSLTFQPASVASFLAILDGTATFEAMAAANLDVVISDALASKYTYIKGSGRLIGTGVMTDAERDALKALASADDSFKGAVDALFAAPELFLAENVGGLFTDLAEANANLLDHPAQTAAATPEERLVYVYEHFVPLLKSMLRRDAITQHIASLIRMSEEATALLIASDVESLIADLSMAGHSATYFSDAAWTTEAEPQAGVPPQPTDGIIDFDWGAAEPRAGVPADAFSVRWQSVLAPPASGEYTFVVSVAEQDEVFRLYLDDAMILEKATAETSTSLEVVTTLNASRMHRLMLEYAETGGNAAVRLQWKTATTALEVVPASVAYPAAILDAFAALATVHHRAAKFISGFGLSETELSHFIAFAADFGDIDFKALDAGDWKRIADYVALRDAVPQAQALLTAVFAAAHTASPAPAVADLKTALHQATAWDETSIEDLAAMPQFSLAAADFRNEIALNRLREVIEIAAKTGLAVETIAEWGEAQTDFDLLDETAQRMKNTVKAKYEEADWLELAGNLGDTLRESQQHALIAYLLTRPPIQAWCAERGVTADADALFEYFLIDVQMDACMETSRIVQANASIQMFVNRCLLNLENQTSTGTEPGVAAAAFDRDRWEWMKAYRVWEANRKVFLYPENWLEPEWRNDRSEFFKELESYLVQNDITDRTVEQGFRNYLTSLNEVANLEVCATHRENESDGALKYLHVFARTHTSPYKYFYRRWNETWSPWERVPADVRAVETAGADSGSSGFQMVETAGAEDGNSGVHLVPLVWKNRLFLFWPEFMQVSEAPVATGVSFKEAGDRNMSTFEADKILEIRLAWSEYIDGKWTPKQLSKEYVSAWAAANSPTIEKDFVLTPVIDTETQELRMEIADVDYVDRGGFILADIQAPVRIRKQLSNLYLQGHWTLAREESDYRFWFGRRQRTSKLVLENDTYLRTSTDHKLTPVDTDAELDIAPDDPFFFSDDSRTYFVRPFVVRIPDRVKTPDAYAPLLYGLRSKSETPARDGSVKPAPTTRANVSNVKNLAKLTTAIGPAFSGNDRKFSDEVFSPIAQSATALEFHTFYHPFSSTYVQELNRGGLSGLMESDTTLESDDGVKFEKEYDPDFTREKVRKPSDFATRTYYKENVCFDAYGANSSYNWELFFHAPLYIATRLSRNGRFEEAMRWFHTIFDPTTDSDEAGLERYWKVLPFKTEPAESIEELLGALSPSDGSEDALVAAWRDNPFDPHLVASTRPIAYMKHVVVKYVENLVAWGDSLFRQDTTESVNEAIQLYVIANHILGPRPDLVPRRGDVAIETYKSLESKWDDFSNALVEMENLFPYSSNASVSDSASGPSLLGVGSALYFCIPSNDKLLAWWDTVADRLFKIRHCQNIDGVERKLALFAPPIDPAALIQATSQGLSLGSILADLSSPPPIYRFSFLVQKANELCSDVKQLGSALLAALEKKDAEELSRLRSSQETQMLELMTAIRERQVLIARAGKEQLEKARETASFRLGHYCDLLGNTVSVPAAPTISASLTADSQLPVDTALAKIVTDVDESLADTDEAGVKVIAKEKEELDELETAHDWQMRAQGSEALATIAHIIPTLHAKASPFGVGAGVAFGGLQVGNALNAAGKVFNFIGGIHMHAAATAAKMAGFIRREQDWTLQANLAAKEIITLDKQLTSADIQVQVAEKELENHRQSIENAEQVERFLRDKFTNEELYQWMKEQLFAVYKQSYNLCYDMARKAEKAFQHEIGTDTARFIQYGYWDNSQHGLVAGDKLQLALRQMEKAYLEENRRELELTKNVSLARLDPLALIELRETGMCRVSLPEELFDLDFRGHYFRRIKAVRLSIPCVAGPHTSIGCSLRLLRNSVRINTSMNGGGTYEHENDAGEWIDDDRFRTNLVPVTAIATSQGQSDFGMFELNFRDERYLPFEGAGVISEWQIELSTEKEFRQFDYATISDVILHINYTARESGGLFKQNASTHLQEFLTNQEGRLEQPQARMFSMRHDFPSEWYRFLHPAVTGAEQILGFTLSKDRFPFFVQDRDVVVMQIALLAKCTESTEYDAIVSYVGHDEDPATSTAINLVQTLTYGELHQATIGANDAGLALEELDVEAPMSLKLKRRAAAGFTGLATTPKDEVEDLFVVFSYKLQ